MASCPLPPSDLICHAGEQWELDGIVWKTKSGP
jgi:hypothetical protein